MKICDILLPSFTSPFVFFLNIAFTDLLTEPLLSARHCAEFCKGYKDKSGKSTFPKVEGEISNCQADYRVGKSNCPL